MFFDSDSLSLFIGYGEERRRCAACKKQRKKCTPNCIFAPHFPADQPEKFANVEKLYGCRKVRQMIRKTDPQDHENLVHSIIEESNMRATNPVRGSLVSIDMLQHQIRLVEDELSHIRQQLEVLIANSNNNNDNNNINNKQISRINVALKNYYDIIERYNF